MARRAKGPLVFFRKVIRGKTKAQPYLKPGLTTGQRVMRIALRKVIATSQGLSSAQIRAKLSIAVRTGALATQQAAQRRAPRGISNPGLASTINARQLEEFLWRVGVGAPYGRFVEKGTKGGQIIRPKRARALSFRWANAPSGVRRKFSRRGRRR